MAFFPSFAFLAHAVGHWRTTGAWAQLAGRKALFQEPRAASEVDGLLKDYGLAALDDQAQVRAAGS